MRDLPSLLDPGDRAGLQRHQGHSGAACTASAGAATLLAQVDATLHMRTAPDRWLAFVRPGKRVAAGDRIHFGHDQNSCFLGAARRDRDREARGRRGAARLRPLRPVPRRGAACRRPYSAAALYRVEAAGRRARPHRLPDDLCPRRRRGRGAHGRAAFHAGAFRGARRARHRAAFRDAACRGGDVSAGQGRRHRRPQDACRDRPCLARRSPTAINAAKARGSRVVCVGTTSLRLLESAATRGRQLSGLVRRDRHLHHAGLPLQHRRRADDQFPSAALDAVHAGLGFFRAGDACARPIPMRSKTHYRFYSYGDASLLFSAEE